MNGKNPGQARFFEGGACLLGSNESGTRRAGNRRAREEFFEHGRARRTLRVMGEGMRGTGRA